MAEYINDGGAYDEDALFTGTKETDYDYDATNKLLWFSSTGVATSSFIIPDAPWILYEVYAPDSYTNDLTGTVVHSKKEWTSTVGVIATTIGAWKSVYDGATGFGTYKIKATHYKGSNVADVYFADEGEGFSLTGGTEEGIEDGTFTGHGTAWVLEDDLFASNVTEQGQTYNTAIVIDNTKVSGSTDFTDFVVTLTEANFSANASTLFDNCKTDGGDLRFYSDASATTQLPAEIVSMDTTGDTLEIYVLVPSIDTAADTTIYVRYGDSSLNLLGDTDTYGRDAVWADYLRVHHFTDDPSGGTLTDSSGNTDGTTEGTWVLGDRVNNASTLGDGWQFDGTQAVILGASASDVDRAVTAANTHHMIAFAQLDSATVYEHILGNGYGTDAANVTEGFGTDATGRVFSRAGSDAGYTTGTVTSGNYYCMVGRATWVTNEGIDNTVTVDGSDLGEQIWMIENTNQSVDVLLGAIRTASNNTGLTYPYTQIMSEFRLSKNETYKTDDWTVTAINSVDGRDSFCTASTPSAL